MNISPTRPISPADLNELIKLASASPTAQRAVEVHRQSHGYIARHRYRSLRTLVLLILENESHVVSETDPTPDMI